MSETSQTMEAKPMVPEKSFCSQKHPALPATDAHLCLDDEVLDVLQQNVGGQGRHDAANIGCSNVRDESVHGGDAYDAHEVLPPHHAQGPPACRQHLHVHALLPTPHADMT